MTAIRGSQAEPPCRQGSEDMAMSEQGDMALDRAHLRNHTIDSGSNLVGAFPPWAAVGEHHPPGGFCLDLLWG